MSEDRRAATGNEVRESTGPAVEPTHAPTPARAPWVSAALLAGGYFVLASAYLVISSSMAGATAVSKEDLERIERLKGLTFMAVTALILFGMNLYQLRTLRAHQDDRIRRDRALANAERNILAGTFARGVAHDINNGLAVATLSLEELRERVTGDAEASELTDDVHAALEQIKEWNRRFFELGSTRLLGEERDFDLAATLRLSAQLAHRHDHVRRAHLEVALPAAAPIRGREALVQRAVLNLVVNAAEAAGPGSKVHLELTGGAGAPYRISVSDSGPGVPVELREKILEPFYTSKPDGTGLGLASVVACASLHGGSVAIEDSTLGGARFTMELRSDVSPGA